MFWDFDGTLARRQDLWAGALADAWKRMPASPAISSESLRPYLGSGFPWHDPTVVSPPLSPEKWWAALRPVFVAAYARAGLDPGIGEEAAALVAIEYYRPDAWTLIDGAVEALRITATAGYRNVILSNHAPELPSLVEALALGPLVEDTITSASVGAEKPNRLIFTHAIERAGISSVENVWMVGDNPTADIAGAAGVGIRGILADGDYPDSVGVTVLEAAELISGQRAGAGPSPADIRTLDEPLKARR